MDRTIIGAALLSFWVGSGGAVLAQPALERLEASIRDRLEAPQPAEPAAIPANPPAAQPAEARPHAQPGYLGVVADDKTDRGRGVRVLQVRPQGPAELGGLRKQDLITAVAGIRVRQMSDMADVLELFGVGEAVIFEIVRDEKARQVKVTLGPQPAVPLLPPLPPTVTPPGTPPAAPVPPEPVAPMPGDPNPPAGAASEVQRLQQRVEQLERRVADLERVLAEVLKKKE